MSVRSDTSLLWPFVQLLFANRLTQIVAAINAMNDALAGTERVLSTPLPLAYRIAISQITWVYVLVLPFQLFGELRWITIPGTISETSFNTPIPPFDFSRCFWIKLLTILKISRRIHHPRNRPHRSRNREPLRQRRQRSPTR